jgi:sugar phosphate isomerase/epimerase
MYPECREAFPRPKLGWQSDRPVTFVQRLENRRFSMFSTSYILVDLVSNFDTQEDFRHALKLLKDIGYDGAEINISDPSTFDLDHAADSTKELDIAISSIMTGGAYADGLCLTSPEVSVRRNTVARLVSFIPAAKRLHAVLVVGLLQGLRTDEPDPDIANKRIVECFREVAPAAEEQGVEFVLEPVNHLQVGFNNSVQEVLETIERIESPAFKPMVDTLHLHIEEHLPVQCVVELGKNLRHVHLSESNGGLLGSGNADLAGTVQVLKRMDYDHFVSVKVYRTATWRDAAQAAMAYLTDLAVSEARI